MSTANIKVDLKKKKTIHFGHACAALFLQTIAIYLLAHQEYQRFLFYTLFALVNLALAIYRRPLDTVFQVLTKEGQLDKTVFKLDLNSPSHINKILNRLRIDTTLDRMKKKYLNTEHNIPFAFVSITASEAEIKKASPDETPAAFFKAAVELKGTHKTAVKLFKEIIEYNKRHGEFETLICDYKTGEVPYGLYLGTYLVGYSKHYCHLYGQFIKTLDMDHEVHEADVIFEAFEKYGCCPETLELLAVRCFTASGQDGMAELSYHIKNHGLNEYLSNQQNYKLFLKQLRNEVNYMSQQNKADNPPDKDDDEPIRKAGYLITEEIAEFCQYYLEESVIANNPNAPISKVFKDLNLWVKDNSPLAD